MGGYIALNNWARERAELEDVILDNHNVIMIYI
jgi:hypothetical protein